LTAPALWQRSKVLVVAGGCCNAFSCQIWSRLTEGTYKVLYSIQAHSKGGPIIVSHERVLQKGIGTRGLSSGTIMQLLEGNSKFRLDDGHIQHTGNGYGTPPLSTTFTELRTELFTTIYQHSPNVALAQVWHTLSLGKSRSE
jgi:hypothetical protein